MSATPMADIYILHLPIIGINQYPTGGRLRPPVAGRPDLPPMGHPSIRTGLGGSGFPYNRRSRRGGVPIPSWGGGGVTMDRTTILEIAKVIQGAKDYWVTPPAPTNEPPVFVREGYHGGQVDPDEEAYHAWRSLQENKDYQQGWDAACDYIRQQIRQRMERLG